MKYLKFDYRSYKNKNINVYLPWWIENVLTVVVIACCVFDYICVLVYKIRTWRWEEKYTDHWLLPSAWSIGREGCSCAERPLRIWEAMCIGRTPVPHPHCYTLSRSAVQHTLSQLHPRPRKSRFQSVSNCRSGASKSSLFLSVIHGREKPKSKWDDAIFVIGITVYYC